MRAVAAVLCVLQLVVVLTEASIAACRSGSCDACLDIELERHPLLHEESSARQFLSQQCASEAWLARLDKPVRSHWILQLQEEVLLSDIFSNGALRRCFRAFLASEPERSTRKRRRNLDLFFFFQNAQNALALEDADRFCDLTKGRSIRRLLRANKIETCNPDSVNLQTYARRVNEAVLRVFEKGGENSVVARFRRPRSYQRCAGSAHAEKDLRSFSRLNHAFCEREVEAYFDFHATEQRRCATLCAIKKGWYQLCAAGKKVPRIGAIDSSFLQKGDFKCGPCRS